MKKTTQKIVTSAMLATLVLITTIIIKIPSPFRGYLNFGDGAVLVCGWILSPLCAFFAAGIGSALADIFSGYIIYAPATFIIKGLMALVASFSLKLINKKSPSLPCRLIGCVIAEIIMVIGYFLFESILYGFEPSIINIPANAVQGIFGLIIGSLLIKAFEKGKIPFLK